MPAARFLLKCIRGERGWERTVLQSGQFLMRKKMVSTNSFLPIIVLLGYCWFPSVVWTGHFTLKYQSPLWINNLCVYKLGQHFQGNIWKIYFHAIKIDFKSVFTHMIVLVCSTVSEPVKNRKPALITDKLLENTFDTIFLLYGTFIKF